MTLAFIYPRRAYGGPIPEYRQDTLELLQRRRYPGGQSIVDSLRKNAFKMTRKIYPDQIAHMDPILRNHLRVGPTKRRITWLG